MEEATRGVLVKASVAGASLRSVDVADLVVADLGDRGLIDLCRTVARVHGVTVIDVAGRRRAPGLDLARREVWVAVARERMMSATELARLFRRDQSTISASLRRARSR